MTEHDAPEDTGRFDEPTGQYTTGHSWDGIEELNTPMPRWWLGIFYLTIFFSVGYMIAMPSLPYFRGLLNHTARSAVADDLVAAGEGRREYADKLAKADFVTIQEDPALFRFAMAAGKSAFGDNCATCHGAGGQGFKGYPNLNDDVWLWGGSFEDIRHTLEVGIRASHDDTRFNLMQAYGEPGFMTRDQIRDIADYLLSLSGAEADADALANGSALYAENCTTCHGVDAKGDRSQGAPNLTDREWLYGGDRSDIEETLWFGRAGVMPNWNERLSDETITALAVYVHSLGGGEPSELGDAEDMPGTP